VKTLAHRNGSIVLEAANPAERDITVATGMDFGILGVVCGVFRPGFDANLGGNSFQS
jgi:SOS-response transcriptional repressor LexA